MSLTHSAGEYLLFHNKERLVALQVSQWLGRTKFSDLLYLFLYPSNFVYDTTNDTLFSPDKSSLVNSFLTFIWLESSRSTS